MSDRSTEQYHVRDFAKRSGVTVRTLHHYDTLGLLKPSGYSEAGYRLYNKADMVRLQQIVMLKFIGFSLKQIKELLDGHVYEVEEMLRLQRSIMEERRTTIESAIRAIDRALEFATVGGEPGWEVFENIIRVVTMENNKDWMKKYYSEEQLAALEQRAQADPDAVRKGTEEWAALIKEVEASLDEDPAGPKGQELAARWCALVERFTQGDPGISESLRSLYADEANWPAAFKKPYSDEVEAFINKAQQARTAAK